MLARLHRVHANHLFPCAFRRPAARSDEPAGRHVFAYDYQRLLLVLPSPGYEHSLMMNSFYVRFPLFDHPLNQFS